MPVRIEISDENMFRAICEGKKTAEGKSNFSNTLRTYDVRPGTLIEFYHSESVRQARVVERSEYSNINEMVKMEGWQNLIPTASCEKECIELYKNKYMTKTIFKNEVFKAVSLRFVLA